MQYVSTVDNCSNVQLQGKFANPTSKRSGNKQNRQIKKLNEKLRRQQTETETVQYINTWISLCLNLCLIKWIMIFAYDMIKFIYINHLHVSFNQNQNLHWLHELQAAVSPPDAPSKDTLVNPTD